MVNGIGRRALASGLAAAAFFVAAPAGAQKPLAMLDRITPGQWVVRTREAGDEDLRLCLEQGRALIQLRHRGIPCRQVVVQDGDAGIQVSYSCGPAGSGMTRIRFENEELVQIETQGIAQGLPFAFAGEARRQGACPR
jgi:hypothetical protein